MQRGLTNEQRIAQRVAYIHGRIERELEAFAGSLAIPAVELTARVGALLLGAGEWASDRLPALPQGSPLEAGAGSVAVATLEGASESHGRGSRRGSAKKRRANKTAPDQVKTKKAKKWTAAQTKKFSATMKRIWREKRRAAKEAEARAA
jgi:hypothetical protein